MFDRKATISTELFEPENRKANFSFFLNELPCCIERETKPLSLSTKEKLNLFVKNVLKNGSFTVIFSLFSSFPQLTVKCSS